MFSHSCYFYSASSSPLLLRGAADTARILAEFHAEAPQATVSEGLAQGLYVAARAGFEPTTLLMKGDESTNEPPHPTNVNYIREKIKSNCRPSSCCSFLLKAIEERGGQPPVEGEHSAVERTGTRALDIQATT